MTRRRESTGRTGKDGSAKNVRHIKDAKRAIEARNTRDTENGRERRSVQNTHSARSHKKSNRKREIQRRKRRRVLFGLILFCLVFVVGIVCFILHRYVSKYPEDKICKNIYISSVDVSGMTKKEALKAMETYLGENRQIKVTLQVGTKSAEATLEELGLEYKDIEKTINSAYSYGKSGNLFQKYLKLRKLSKEKLVIKEKYTLSKKSFEKTLKDKAVPLADHAVNATMTKSSDGFDIVPEKSGQTVDMKKSMTSIKKKLNNGWKKKDFSVELIQKKENPTVKEEDLKTVKDKLGSYSTDAGGGERWQNLKTGSSKLNGIVLAPGEELSVHEVTAPYDKEHGYVAAGSYENGQVVETYGGGICQVSTTLYNAILFAELEVTERYPHSMLVAYVKPSRDAAIAGDVKDLKFKNNYDTPIYIEGYIDDSNQLTFNIYGKDTRKAGRTLEFESETLSTEEAGRTYKADSSAPLGSMEYEGSPHTGKTARLWKIVKKDGKQVSRDVVNESTYQKSDEIIVVGTASENGAASGVVESAIATQDGTKINEAISKAKAMQ